MAVRHPRNPIGLALSVFVLSLAAGGVGGQEVRARVVDQERRRPLDDAVATLKLLDGTVVASGVTDGDGFFRVSARGRGTYVLVVERAGYEPTSRQVGLSGEEAVTLPAFVLAADVMALDSIEVRGRRRGDAGVALSTAARSSQVVAGERMARIEAGAGSLRTVLRELPHVRVREWMDRTGRPFWCVESNRRLPTMAGPAADGCSWATFVVDGFPVDVSMAITLLRTPGLADYESIEFLTPLEAGTQYGMDASANGAVVIWTRGKGPHASPARTGR